MAQDSVPRSSATHDFYERYWAEGRLVENPCEQWKAEKLRAVLGMLQPHSVLDVGCGNGRVLEAVTAPSSRRFGVDLSEHAIGELRRRGLEGCAADVEVEPLPVPDASFDMALCLDVLEHVFDPDRLVREIRRVLRPGGRLAVTVPNAMNAFNRLAFILGRPVDIMDKAHVVGEPFSEHIRLFSRNILEAMFERARFVVERREFFFPSRFTDARFRFAAPLAELVARPRLHERLPSLFALEFLYVARKL